MQPTEDKIRDNMKPITVLDIKMMDDEEWNRLAYLNYLERNSKQK